MIQLVFRGWARLEKDQRHHSSWRGEGRRAVANIRAQGSVIWNLGDEAGRESKNIDLR